MAGSIDYAAAGHGIVGIMRVYANILATHSIRVNSVRPREGGQISMTVGTIIGWRR
jgi:NAD(P)-dependent dehydrogenase (short-subunit alcohol dehydrogenase family)